MTPALREVLISILPSPVKWLAIGSSHILEEDSRLDAAAYNIDKFDTLRRIEACPLMKASLGSLCGTIWHPVQNQARSNFKRIYTRPEFGDPYVGSREMFFFPLRPDKFLSRAFPKLQELRVPKGWILVSRSGTVGNVLFCSERLSNCLITDHAIRIESLSVPAGYLYTFLSCRYGRPLLLSSTYGSTVSELEPKHIAALPVPIIEEVLQNEIHQLIVDAYLLRDQASDLLNEAEDQLYRTLNVGPFDENDVEYFSKGDSPKTFTISAEELWSRFDASYHVPISRSAIHKMGNTNFSLKNLKDLGVSAFHANRYARIYVDQQSGVPFLQCSQMPLFRPYDSRFLSKTANAKDIDACLLREGDLLVTRSGTIGRIGYISKDIEGHVASDDFIRLRFNDSEIDAGYIYCFLSTGYGQAQLTGSRFGGVIEHINIEHVQDVLVPYIGTDVRKKISSLVAKAFSNKDHANRLENQAIERLEKMIEGSLP